METVDLMGTLVVDQVFMPLRWGKAREEHLLLGREPVVLAELAALAVMAARYFKRQ